MRINVPGGTCKPHPIPEAAAIIHHMRPSPYLRPAMMSNLSLSCKANSSMMRIFPFFMFSRIAGIAKLVPKRLLSPKTLVRAYLLMAIGYFFCFEVGVDAASLFMMISSSFSEFEFWFLESFMFFKMAPTLYGMPIGAPEESRPGLIS